MPTIRRCCIVGCLSNSRQSPQLQFFQFPRPENPFYSLWKQACHASLNRILPFKKPVVCALHFHPNLIGGRRLMSSAVPSLRLDVPNDLKAVEQQAMVEEIERSRKCAYINAVVYEWLVRANLNPQLRGSITHGMIKDKAASAAQLIGSTSFVADNRWLNRFRETHLSGFAQKLANNQLKPLGVSLWINDIVQDLQHLFPPTSAERIAKLESLPEQYMDYMQQYGEYEEDDDQDSQNQSIKEQQQQSYHHQQQQGHGGYDAYGQPISNYNGSYDGYEGYYDRQSQHNSYSSPQPQRPASNSPPLQQLQKLASPAHRASPVLPPPVKRPRSSVEEGSEINGTNNVTDLTNECETNDCDVKPIKLNGIPSPNGSNGLTPAPSPKPITNGNTNGKTNGNIEDNHSNGYGPELTTYAEALEHLKPIEEFALSMENFRAIGLISQLEAILRKGENKRLAAHTK
uniref:HTH CENPB-type domain-containing protein n=1 Tax=Ceratitis capitata TaxID=7213 RepID=W8BFV9_CERCA